MSDYRPPPLGDDIDDLRDLCAKVQQRYDTAIRAEDPLILLTDPPFVTMAPAMFVLRCDLATMALGVAGVVALFFWTVPGFVLLALAALAWLVRWLVYFTVVAPARRRVAQCRVVPAAVVQAFLGGFEAPEDIEEARPFTGVVVFDLDQSKTVQELGALARTCLAAKSGPDDGPLVELKRLLIAGDTSFEHETFHLFEAVAGNDQTHATQIMFNRKNDLHGGYLSTKVQLILAHPKHPGHVCPVPLALFESDRSMELLRGQ